MKREITTALLLGLLLTAATAHARLMYAWNYDELHKKADLVVIATPTAVRQLKERSPLPNITSVSGGGQSSSLIGHGVETDFRVVAVLKGAIKGGSLTLHHYELPPAPMINGPGLVAFDPKGRKQYLMFLVRQPDGRYAALSGQTDPDQSIEPLYHAAP